MPVVNFYVVWPDQSESKCYSPSQVIKEHLEAGQVYPLSDFMTRVRLALNLASERVRAKYGFACSAAQDQLDVLESIAGRFSGAPDAAVKVTGFSSNDIY